MTTTYTCDDCRCQISVEDNVSNDPVYCDCGALLLDPDEEAPPQTRVRRHSAPARSPWSGRFFAPRDYGFFIAGVLGLSGFFVVPTFWPALLGVDMSFGQSLPWALASAVAFLYAFGRDGKVSVGRVFVAGASLCGLMVMYAYVGFGDAYAATGLLALGSFFVTGYIGVAIGRLVPTHVVEAWGEFYRGELPPFEPGAGELESLPREPTCTICREAIYSKGSEPSYCPKCHTWSHEACRKGLLATTCAKCGTKEKWWWVWYCPACKTARNTGIYDPTTAESDIKAWICDQCKTPTWMIPAMQVGSWENWCLGIIGVVGVFAFMGIVLLVNWATGGTVPMPPSANWTMATILIAWSAVTVAPIFIAVILSHPLVNSLLAHTLSDKEPDVTRRLPASQAEVYLAMGRLRRLAVHHRYLLAQTWALMPYAVLLVTVIWFILKQTGG